MQHLPSVLGNSHNVPQVLSENVKAAAARLPLSRSLDIAADLLAQFPNCKGDDIFTRSMAELFNRYPASIVSQITSMKTGLATKSEFLSLAAMTKWLDEKSETIIYAADWDRRALSLSAPPEDRSSRPTYDELKAKAGENWGLVAVDGDAERKAAIADQIVKANQAVFLRECERDGIDPARGVSPALLKTLEKGSRPTPPAQR